MSVLSTAEMGSQPAVRDRWVWARRRLERKGIADAAIEAEFLLRHALGWERAEFFAALHSPLNAEATTTLDRLVRRRMSGEPLAYIAGKREFYGLEFVVNRHVLVPRQETELLVDLVIQSPAAMRRRRFTVADVGTGCGSIAVVVATQLAGATVYAADLSRDALAVADNNRRAHRVADRVHLRHGDLLDALPGPVDVIVSNLPYIATGDIAGLAPELQWEPRLALDGGLYGLDLIERLLGQAASLTRPGGRIVLEISPEQREPVIECASANFPQSEVGDASDLLGLTRAVIVDLPSGS